MKFGKILNAPSVKTPAKPKNTSKRILTDLFQTGLKYLAFSSSGSQAAKADLIRTVISSGWVAAQEVVQ